MKPGDLVKRFDIPGTGTGILYRVLSIGIEREYHVLRRINGYKTRTKMMTRKVKLQPVIVMFESKFNTSRRANVTHYQCDLKVLDLVEMGGEYVKLGLLIQDEARRLAGEPQDTKLQDQLRTCHREADPCPS